MTKRIDEQREITRDLLARHVLRLLTVIVIGMVLILAL